MRSFRVAWKIVRDLGPKWVLQRLSFAAQMRSGIVKRRLPVGDWDFIASEGRSTPEHPKTQAIKKRFFFNSGQLPTPRSQQLVCEQADRVLSGELPLFSNQWQRIGFPPEWHFNSLDGTRVPDRDHWSQINIGKIHDVKFVWEPSRFSVAYVLARAYAASGDERYPDAFWRLIADWADKNPPNRGVNWASGQEVALRVMAWCFALYAFGNSSCSTPERTSKLLRMIEVHGVRIAGYIGYALSQRNNHGISEAVGLFTIGMLFPELRRASEWKKLGKKLIESQVREQVYEDGSYIQHSFNYQRVLIDLLVWSFALGEINGERFSEENYEIFDRAVQFLLRFCDPQTGRVPNYGSNDGSLVLPLSSCDFLDYRPSLQAAHYLLHHEFCFEKGDWCEQCDWLFGTQSVRGNENRPPPRTELHQSESSSGYLKLVARESSAMLRATHYVDRPSQADQLHFDLWWRGENITCDPGTYLYNALPPWRNALGATAVHNTVTVGDRDEMTRAGRFLWIDWAQANWRECELRDSCRAIEAWHGGYKNLGATHRRSVSWIADQDYWVVVDDVYGDFHGRVRLHWLFANYPHEWMPDELTLLLQTPSGAFQCCIHAEESNTGTLVIGADVQSQTDSEIRGWRSLYYGQKEPAVSLAVEREGAIAVRFVTVLAPSTVRVSKISNTNVELTMDTETYFMSLRPTGSEQIFSDVRRVVAPAVVTS